MTSRWLIPTLNSASALLGFLEISAISQAVDGLIQGLDAAVIFNQISAIDTGIGFFAFQFFHK